LAYWAVHDLFQLRKVLEGYGARLSASCSTADEIDEMKQLVCLMGRKVEADDEYFEQNSNFHLRIALSSRNSILFYCMSNLINGFRDVRMKFNRHLSHMGPQDAIEHMAIVEAIEQRDHVLAEQRMHSHIESYLQQLRKLQHL